MSDYHYALSKIRKITIQITVQIQCSVESFRTETSVWFAAPIHVWSTLARRRSTTSTTRQSCLRATTAPPKSSFSSAGRTPATSGPSVASYSSSTLASLSFRFSSHSPSLFTFVVCTVVHTYNLRGNITNLFNEIINNNYIFLTKGQGNRSLLNISSHSLGFIEKTQFHSSSYL